jgi:hypothetical protein
MLSHTGTVNNEEDKKHTTQDSFHGVGGSKCDKWNLTNTSNLLPRSGRAYTFIRNVWKKHKGRLSKHENLYSSCLKDLKAETMVQDVEELKGARKDGWNILLEYVRTFHILPCSPQKEFLTVFVYHSF